MRLIDPDGKADQEPASEDWKEQSAQVAHEEGVPADGKEALQNFGETVKNVGVPNAAAAANALGQAVVATAVAVKPVATGVAVAAVAAGAVTGAPLAAALAAGAGVVGTTSQTAITVDNPSASNITDLAVDAGSMLVGGAAAELKPLSKAVRSGNLTVPEARAVGAVLPALDYAACAAVSTALTSTLTQGHQPTWKNARP